MLERVNKIREKEFINWYYVPTKENPADIGIRGSLIVNISRVWWEGPSWLPDKTKWPNQPLITSATESEKKTKRIKELVAIVIQSNQRSEYNYLLSKYELLKTLRILAWIYRFINNSRKVIKSGPLTSKEIERRRKYLIEQVQREVEHSEKFIDNKKRLNLHKNQEEIYECRGRIEGPYSAYIPSKSI